MGPNTKRAELLKDPDLERWYRNVSRGSPITAEVHLRRLSLFCEQNGLTPKELVDLGRRNRKKLEDMMEDHVTRMESQKKSPGYIAGILKGARSWLAHNEVVLTRKVKISNRGATPTIEDERVPEKQELRALLMYGDERTSAAMCLVAMAGLRLEVLGNARGDDGLTVGDLPELKIKEGCAEFTKTPTMIMVRPSLSKSNNKYFTFLPKECCDHLAAYLNKRLSEGEEFTLKTAAVATKPGYGNREGTESHFMTTRNVSRMIREAMRPRFKWRPYVLRAYFDTQMLLAESHGKIAHPYRVFFMGHKGDMEARCSTNKGRLPEDLAEDMWKAFAASSEYLETTPRLETDKKEMLLEMWREQAELYGIDPMKVKIEKERELKKELTIEEEEEFLKIEIKKWPCPKSTTTANPTRARSSTKKN